MSNSTSCSSGVNIIVDNCVMNDILVSYFIVGFICGATALLTGLRFGSEYFSVNSYPNPYKTRLIERYSRLQFVILAIIHTIIGSILLGIIAFILNPIVVLMFLFTTIMAFYYLFKQLIEYIVNLYKWINTTEPIKVTNDYNLFDEKEEEEEEGEIVPDYNTAEFILHLQEKILNEMVEIYPSFSKLGITGFFVVLDYKEDKKTRYIHIDIHIENQIRDKHIDLDEWIKTIPFPSSVKKYNIPIRILEGEGGFKRC